MLPLEYSVYVVQSLGISPEWPARRQPFCLSMQDDWLLGLPGPFCKPSSSLMPTIPSPPPNSPAAQRHTCSLLPPPISQSLPVYQLPELPHGLITNKYVVDMSRRGRLKPPPSNINNAFLPSAHMIAQKLPSDADVGTKGLVMGGQSHLSHASA